MRNIWLALTVFALPLLAQQANPTPGCTADSGATGGE